MINIIHPLKLECQLTSLYWMDQRCKQSRESCLEIQNSIKYMYHVHAFCILAWSKPAHNHVHNGQPFVSSIYGRLLNPQLLRNPAVFLISPPLPPRNHIINLCWIMRILIWLPFGDCQHFAESAFWWLAWFWISPVLALRDPGMEITRDPALICPEINCVYAPSPENKLDGNLETWGIFCAIMPTNLFYSVCTENITPNLSIA